MSSVLRGGPKKHSGSAGMKQAMRLRWTRDLPSTARVLEAFAGEGIEIVETGTFPLDPTRAQELATGIIAQMKDAGVTTVVVRADPITLPAFTREATKQEWFPEWVIGGYLPGAAVGPPVMRNCNDP